MSLIRLHVSRSVVSVEGPERARESTRALVALGIEAGRTGIIAVGEDEPELIARLSQPRSGERARGLRAQIVAKAADKVSADTPLRVLRPGQDPYWDRAWQDTYALRTADPAHSREVLLIEPLSEDSWSPHLIQGLLMYVLWTSPWTRDKLWPVLRRPQVELCPAEDLRGLHYEELVDQLRILWGLRRVLLPADLPVAEPPVTRAVRVARVSHVIFWIALLSSFALWGSGTAAGAGLVSAAVALFAFLVRRASLARSKAELPRRQG